MNILLGLIAYLLLSVAIGKGLKRVGRHYRVDEAEDEHPTPDEIMRDRAERHYD